MSNERGKAVTGELHLRGSYYSCSIFARAFMQFARLLEWDVTGVQLLMPEPNADTPIDVSETMESAIDARAVKALTDLGLEPEQATALVVQSRRLGAVPEVGLAGAAVLATTRFARDGAAELADALAALGETA